MSEFYIIDITVYIRKRVRLWMRKHHMQADAM